MAAQETTHVRDDCGVRTTSTETVTRTFGVEVARVGGGVALGVGWLSPREGNAPALVAEAAILSRDEALHIAALLTKAAS